MGCSFSEKEKAIRLVESRSDCSDIMPTPRFILAKRETSREKLKLQVVFGELEEQACNEGESGSSQQFNWKLRLADINGSDNSDSEYEKKSTQTRLPSRLLVQSKTLDLCIDAVEDEQRGVKLLKTQHHEQLMVLKAMIDKDKGSDWIRTLSTVSMNMPEEFDENNVQKMEAHFKVKDENIGELNEQFEKCELSCSRSKLLSQRNIDPCRDVKTDNKKGQQDNDKNKEIHNDNYINNVSTLLTSRNMKSSEIHKKFTKPIKTQLHEKDEKLQKVSKKLGNSRWDISKLSIHTSFEPNYDDQDQIKLLKIQLLEKEKIVKDLSKKVKESEFKISQSKFNESNFESRDDDQINDLNNKKRKTEDLKVKLKWRGRSTAGRRSTIGNDFFFSSPCPLLRSRSSSGKLYDAVQNIKNDIERRRSEMTLSNHSLLLPISPIGIQDDYKRDKISIADSQFACASFTKQSLIPTPEEKSLPCYLRPQWMSRERCGPDVTVKLVRMVALSGNVRRWCFSEACETFFIASSPTCTGCSR